MSGIEDQQLPGQLPSVTGFLGSCAHHSYHSAVLHSPGSAVRFAGHHSGCQHTCLCVHHQHAAAVAAAAAQPTTTTTTGTVAAQVVPQHFHHQHHLSPAFAASTATGATGPASSGTFHDHSAPSIPSIPSMSCDCGTRSSQEQSASSSRLASADETNPSGSEASSTRGQTRMLAPHAHSEDERICIHRMDAESRMCGVRLEDGKYASCGEVYSDGTDSGVKVTDGGTSEDDQGPPLPPRPPPRPRSVPVHEPVPHSTGLRKYIVWCLICGGISCILGTLLLGIYFLLRSYTSTVGYFETVPTFVPATLLLLTGLCVMSLARRRNRYSYLIKLSGACGLASALTCALVTVTTTVLHMSRLQALRECEYTQKTRTCTCYSVMIESQVEGVDEGVRFVFDSTADCSVVHGALYSCLRAVFGLSVAGVLVAVFSCMLVYQLLSHERKKMYWEQLELRCRSLYAGQGASQQASAAGVAAMMGTPRGGGAGGGGPCRCCEQCHSHRNVIPSAYPWDGENRFWTPGQAGNFYSPNPGSDEMPSTSRGGIVQPGGQRTRGPGWSWPRMPWQRNEPQRFRQTPSSPDSQYGFSNTPTTVQVEQQAGAVSGGVQQGYTVIGGPPYGVWGPPPPYSDPNSPARRGRYQYIHPQQCQPMMEVGQPSTLIHHATANARSMAVLECHQHGGAGGHLPADLHSMEPFCPVQMQQHRQQLIKRQTAGGTAFKTKENYENTPSDSDGGARDRFSNTLPVRKTKKRVEIGAKSIGANQSATRVNVQNVFQQDGDIGTGSGNTGLDIQYVDDDGEAGQSVATAKMRRLKSGAGVENNGFQPVEVAQGGDIVGADGIKVMEPTESEVYFADVSSCCNISLKNDNYYEDATGRRLGKDKDQQSGKEEAEDYLAQRFGKREASTRSRLPFPQIIPEDYEKHGMTSAPQITPRASLLHKDISRQSMCSVDSDEKTDFTDLSPATPGSSGFIPAPSFPGVVSVGGNNSESGPFGDPFPFGQDQQEGASVAVAHRFLAPDAQYEIIKEPPQFDTVPLTLSFVDADQAAYTNAQAPTHFLHGKPKSPKNLNITPIKRQNLGTNISAIIQNLGGSDVGLLYPDNPRASVDLEGAGPLVAVVGASGCTSSKGQLIQSQQQLQQPQQQSDCRRL